MPRAGSSFLLWLTGQCRRTLCSLCTFSSDAKGVCSEPASCRRRHRRESIMAFATPARPTILAYWRRYFRYYKNCTDYMLKPGQLPTRLRRRAAAGKPPHACFLGDAEPLYRQKHNPFIYHDAILTRRAAHRLFHSPSSGATWPQMRYPIMSGSHPICATVPTIVRFKWVTNGCTPG